MIDGSKLPFEDNIALTRRVTDACHPGGIPVEGELGRVGGKEDDLENADENPYTDPEEARTFVEKTNVDFLAVGIGTSHGVYKGVPRVNVERLSEIRALVDIPLVLHGTSGVPDEQVRDCVSRGICKVNYATDLRIAFTKGVKAYMQENPDAFDPKKYAARGMEEVKAYVMQKMEVVGSIGKAAN
jgi:tagatose 1,6-diphosphate aldolase GatY/KbaY